MTTSISTAFSFLNIDLGNENELSIIDIEKIDHALEEYIDSKFISICEGNVEADLTLVKQRLIDFLTTKLGSTTEMGAIAEFFLHLFLNERGYEPQFLFFNLEENSIKKGFDGYYHYNGAQWILESKSGSIGTKGISHSKKVKESYVDLVDKLTGNGPNSPWRNAYSHASHIDVQAKKDVRENIRKFTNEYDRKIFHKIDDFNIIPGATIFLEGNWASSDASIVEKEISALIKTMKFKQIKVICITKKSLSLFWDYLRKK
jgi:hypothetical protein